VADRAQGCAADLAHPLGDCVGGGENLVGLLVHEKMMIAKMRTGYVPMKVLCLQVQRKHIGKQDVQRA
jgi:hypothetical protein